MSKAGEIISVSPRYLIAGGEFSVECRDLEIGEIGTFRLWVGDAECKIVGASSRKVVAFAPEVLKAGPTNVRLESGGDTSNEYEIITGEQLVTDMHIVANPAVDPKDDSIFFTRSGGRGQDLPNTLYR